MSKVFRKMRNLNSQVAQGKREAETAASQKAGHQVAQPGRQN